MVVFRFFGKDWSGAARRCGDPGRYRVDDGAAARRCGWMGWGWDRLWRRRPRSFCPRFRAREPALLSPVLSRRLLQLLPADPGVLFGTVLPTRAELLEPVLPILLRLLSSGRAQAFCV